MIPKARMFSERSPEVDVGDAPVERHVRRAVEEGERPPRSARSAGLCPGPPARAALQDAVEVPEGGVRPSRPRRGMPARRSG